MTATALSLTKMGTRIFDMPVAKRQLEFVKLILSHAAFRDTLKLYFAKGVLPSRTEVVAIMKKSDLYKVGSQSTYARRASTVTSWIWWIVRLMKD